MVENKKVFKDDYGKDIVDDDYVDALERMNDERLGHKKKEAAPKVEISTAMKATDFGNYNERDGEP